MIRVTGSLECDGCGTTYDEPERFRKLIRLRKWIAQVRMEARHPSVRASERWSDVLNVGTGPLRRGDYCPRCQAIAARQSLDADPIAARRALEPKPKPRE